MSGNMIDIEKNILGENFTDNRKKIEKISQKNSNLDQTLLKKNSKAYINLLGLLNKFYAKDLSGKHPAIKFSKDGLGVLADFGITWIDEGTAYLRDEKAIEKLTTAQIKTIPENEGISEHFTLTYKCKHAQKTKQLSGLEKSTEYTYEITEKIDANDNEIQEGVENDGDVTEMKQKRKNNALPYLKEQLKNRLPTSKGIAEWALLKNVLKNSGKIFDFVYEWVIYKDKKNIAKVKAQDILSTKMTDDIVHFILLLDEHEFKLATDGQIVKI